MMLAFLKKGGSVMNEKNVPFFMDFAFELPASISIESTAQGKDCTTVDFDKTTGCDDD